ncbi:hypothetical protein, partial [Parazoarcus communis]
VQRPDGPVLGSLQSRYALHPRTQHGKPHTNRFCTKTKYKGGVITPPASAPHLTQMTNTHKAQLHPNCISVKNSDIQ